VKIGCPSLKHDNVLNVGSFYCRKGYYALNVQAIVDRNKIIVWRSIKCRGSEHDSTAFKRSEIYHALVEKYSLLTELGLYILADSVYCLRPFLLTPYDNARHGSPEDAFNYHLSSSRIFIECAFGEIDARWGIFWSPLRFRLEQNINVIDAAMRLHNFIVMYDLQHDNRKNLSKCNEFEEDILKFMAANSNEIVGIFGDEGNDRNSSRGGSETKENRVLKKKGEQVRNNIKDKLHRIGFTRPQKNWFRSHSNRTCFA